jgi:hypothetical protein
LGVKINSMVLLFLLFEISRVPFCTRDA